MVGSRVGVLTNCCGPQVLQQALREPLRGRGTHMMNQHLPGPYPHNKGGGDCCPPPQNLSCSFFFFLEFHEELWRSLCWQGAKLGACAWRCQGFSCSLLAIVVAGGWHIQGHGHPHRTRLRDSGSFYGHQRTWCIITAGPERVARVFLDDILIRFPPAYPFVT